MPIVGPFLTVPQIEQAWIRAGGSPATAEFMAAVAMAESSGGTRSYNVNRDGTTDYGLWQINSSNGGSSALYEPDYGASIAKRLSNNGATVTAWCTAYTDAACGHDGGHYAPTGASPVGRWLTSIRGGAKVYVGATTQGRAVVATASDEPVVRPKADHLPDAFRRLAHSFATTVPTRGQRIDHISRNFLKVVR